MIWWQFTLEHGQAVLKPLRLVMRNASRACVAQPDRHRIKPVGGDWCLGCSSAGPVSKAGKGDKRFRGSSCSVTGGEGHRWAYSHAAKPTRYGFGRVMSNGGEEAIQPARIRPKWRDSRRSTCGATSGLNVLPKAISDGYQYLQRCCCSPHALPRG